MEQPIVAFQVVPMDLQKSARVQLVVHVERKAFVPMGLMVTMKSALAQTPIVEPVKKQSERRMCAWNAKTLSLNSMGNVFPNVQTLLIHYFLMVNNRQLVSFANSRHFNVSMEVPLSMAFWYKTYANARPKSGVIDAKCATTDRIELNAKYVEVSTTKDLFSTKVYACYNVLRTRKKYCHKRQTSLETDVPRFNTFSYHNVRLSQ